MKKITALGLIAALMICTALTVLAASSPLVLAPGHEDEIINESSYQKDKLDQWIDRLADEFECVHCPPVFRHLDTNGEYSYAYLQFQAPTFVYAVKRYRILPAAEDGEILNFIYDRAVQEAVARCMLENEASAWKHWRTSVNRGLGLPPTPETKRCPTTKL